MTINVDLKNIVKQVIPSVVKIETNIGSGSGFLVDNNGTIVTNYHVIEGATEIYVKFGENQRLMIREIKAVDADIDYALLEIDALNCKLCKPLQLGNSDDIAVGDNIFVVSNPLGEFEQSVSTGVISAKRPGINRVQMTAPLSPEVSHSLVLPDIQWCCKIRLL